MSNEQISQWIRTQDLKRQDKRYRVQISKKDMKTILNMFSFHGNANLSLQLDSIFSCENSYHKEYKRQQILERMQEKRTLKMDYSNGVLIFSK